jgi:acyl-CoA synthetase (AMP-forming)/AMP-acid ligase II
LIPVFESGKDLVAPFLERGENDANAPWARSPTAQRTFGESRERILALTRQLAERELPAGSLASLVVTSSPAAVEILAALWLADLVPVLIDPATPPELEHRIATRLGARLAWRAPLDWNDELALDDHWLPAPETLCTLPDAAAVKLTSGTTGEPQGVVVGAAALAADTNALMAGMGLGATDRSLVAIPLSHSYGFSVLTVPALTHGIPLLLPDGAGILETARAHGATFLPSVPAWFQSILRRPDTDLGPTLRTLVSAGAPLDPAVARAFRERFGVPIHSLYGASECGSICYDRTGNAAENGRVGTLLDGVSVDLGQKTPGLVTVRSPAAGLGYLPPRDGDQNRLQGGCYHSEDLARWEADELQLCGRQSDWINVKGHKVDPLVVETALGSHPNVAEVVVVARPDAGDGEQTVRAVIVRRADPMSFMDVIDWCRPRLAPYQMPRSVVFVEALPRNDRGKVDRAQLVAL